MSSRLLLLAIVSMFAAAPLSAAPADEHAVARTIVSFVNAVNLDHEKDALAFFTSDASITEDLAPYHWQGPRAGAAWFKGMASNGAKIGMTEIIMHLGKPPRIEVTGDRAYEVIPGVVALKGKGGSLHESGFITFALEKHGAAWKIAALSWGGERAHP